MEEIQHKQLEISGLSLHVAEVGKGPVVVLLHGFPEIWYSWRHQMLALSKAGYRAIAPDFRGYGLSQLPPHPEEFRIMDLVQDTVAILHALGINKAVVVGKDLGAHVAYLLALFHPERAACCVSLGIPYTLPAPQFYNPELLPEGYYTRRWQEPGRAEADFGRFDVKTVIKRIYILFSRSEMPIANEDQEIMDLVHQSTPLPSWFTEEDLIVYSKSYERSGFLFSLAMYRNMIRKDSTTVIKDLKIRVPTLLIMGSKCFVLKAPGREDFIKSKTLRDHVPNLEIVFVPEGTHFVQEQFPIEANDLIINFINKHADQIK